MIKVAAMDLRFSHTGRKITVTVENGTVTGLLVGIIHRGYVHQVKNHRQDVVRESISREVIIEINGFGQHLLELDQEIEFHND